MAGHRRKVLTPAMCALVAVFGVWSEACFCQPAVTPSTEEVRVGVQLKRLNGDPIDHLSVDDFRVSVGTQIFPLTLARPALKKNTSDSVPTRLLVLFSPPATRGANDPVPQVIENLKPIWSRGWQVSLLTPEGQLTPYASSATELQSLVRQNAGPAKTYEEALQTLQTFPGRRLIVYMSDGQHKAPDGLAKAAHLTEGMLYDVGGDIFQNYTYGESEKGSTPSLPSYGAGLYGPSPGPGTGGLTVVNNVETWSAPAQLSIGDVHNERRFKGAISDAIRDAGNYYELRLRVPSQTAWLVLGVTVKGDYRLTAQAYTLGDNKPPGIVLLKSKP
jgi:hypothetical protein